MHQKTDTILTNNVIENRKLAANAAAGDYTLISFSHKPRKTGNRLSAINFPTSIKRMFHVKHPIQK
ncbi:hypothetical protein BOO22_19070 [Vibrio cidicii]|nr:hypothetical protein [Vibrio cidicii]